jgi:hypothetical protein
MNAAARRTDVAPPTPSAEQLLGICEVLSVRISELETSNAELRARLGLDAPPSLIGSHWSMVKQVAADTGYTESGVWGWVRTGKVDVMRMGGHLFIDTRTLPKTKKRSPRFFSGA